MKDNWPKIILFIIIVTLISMFFIFDLQHYLSLEYVKTRQRAFEDYYAVHRASTIAAYMVVYIVVTALSLPGAAVLSLVGGALFGFIAGLIMVSFASTIGATCAFIVSRFLFRDYVQHKFGDKLETINRGFKKEGAFYLFTLRLVPIFPFFVINLVMGITPIKTVVFYMVSQVGMFPGTIVYVNAGTQLGRIDAASGILSPGLILSFVLLGIFPLLAKKMVAVVKGRRDLESIPGPDKANEGIRRENKTS